MFIRRVWHGLLVALCLASPQQGAWAGGRGLLPPSLPVQAGDPPGRDYWLLPAPGWSAAPEAGDADAGFNLGAVFGRDAIMGLALTGSGVFFIKKGFDYRREADDLYDRYLDALDPAEITRLYQRTNKRDLKSVLSWSLGAVLAASGIRVLLGRYLAALHLELAPPFAQGHPQTGIHGAHVKFSRDF